jgi:hypothetical protein
MGILPMRPCGIGILLMIHGLEAHAIFMGETPMLLKNALQRRYIRLLAKHK